MDSGQSFDVRYGGPALPSATRYYWQVRVWDNDGRVSQWSQPAWFETAFLNPGQFEGSWIGDPHPLSPDGANWIWYPEGDPAQSAPVATRYFRREVDLPANQALARANFLITADDQWLVYVNGHEAGQSSGQANAWAQAQQLDITKELHPGANTIAVAATNAGGPGSWIGKLGLEYTDGTTADLVTDSTWKASQQDQQGWQDPGFNDSAWVPALTADPYGSGPWGTGVSVGSELLLRKNFALGNQAITGARLYVSGLSYPDLYLNGRPVSSDKLGTAFTSYNKTVDYTTSDVTKLLHSASNEIAVSLGNGFYAGGADDYPASGEPWQPAQPKLKLELDVQYANGTATQVVSDPTWQVATGPTSFNSPASEEYDAYQEKPGWTRGNKDTGWVSAAALPAPAGVLQAQLIPPVEETGTVKPVKVTEPLPDTAVYDFGITTSGWTRITMQGVPGTSVAVGYSEKLNSGGTVQSEGNGQAGQVDSYTFKGSGPVTFEPEYGWKGYRYVQVTTNSCPSGVATPCTLPLPLPLPKIGSITGIVAHTALATSGNFTSSSKLLNEMHTAMVNTILNNQYSYGSDTPVYEKGGWTNDNGDYSTSHAIGGPNGAITSTAYDQTANVYGLAFGLAPQGDQQAIAAGLAANVTAQGNRLATGANGSKYILPMLTDYGYGNLAYLVATNPTAPGWGQ